MDKSCKIKAKKEDNYKDSLQDIKKMKQGMSYTKKEKTIILNVFKFFKSEYDDKCVTEIVRRTAKATGCSEKSIFQFRKEEKSETGFKEPSKTKIRRNININSRFIKYDDSVRHSIKNIIYELKYKNIVPSLSTIVKRINSNDSLPKFSLMTLRRLLFDMGFTYEKDGSKSILVEKELPENKNISKPTDYVPNIEQNDTKVHNTDCKNIHTPAHNQPKVDNKISSNIILPMSNNIQMHNPCNGSHQIIHTQHNPMHMPPIIYHNHLRPIQPIHNDLNNMNQMHFKPDMPVLQHSVYS